MPQPCRKRWGFRRVPCGTGWYEVEHKVGNSTSTFFGDINFGHIQLYELWANVKEKGQMLWIWTICEAKTKIIPVLQIGAHTGCGVLGGA